MKKKIITGLSVFTLALSITLFTGCGYTAYSDAKDLTQHSNEFANGYFTIVKKWSDSMCLYNIVYANDTKVMYLICYSCDRKFGITPLYNTDGTLQIYGEGE